MDDHKPYIMLDHGKYVVLQPLFLSGSSCDTGWHASSEFLQVLTIEYNPLVMKHHDISPFLSAEYS